jgi:hypothetical protein
MLLLANKITSFQWRGLSITSFTKVLTVLITFFNTILRTFSIYSGAIFP